MSLGDCEVELPPGNRIAHCVVLHASNIQADQLLNGLTIELIRYGTQFAQSKCKVLLQDWYEHITVPYLGNQRLEIAKSFAYSESYISRTGGVRKKISMRISKARLVLFNLRHLWR